MSLIFRVITAAHARGTHHRLALDGVNGLQGPDAERWQRVFLLHAAALVAGSKAPDDEFKDFKNHVLHPRDDFWGGAADKSVEWYGILVEAMRSGDWPAAAWSAGVLSHYLTDPICPLHTGQSEAENSIHRAWEWSVSRSYDALLAVAGAGNAGAINIAPDGETASPGQAPDAAGWLAALVCQAALESNQHYEKLIAHYDIHRGVVDPPSGLDGIARRIVGDLLVKARSLVAAVLQRAIGESKAVPPDVGLGLETVLAALRIPLNKVLAKLEDSRERRLVERIYDELKATGTVEENLPEDDRLVRDRYAQEVLALRPPPAMPGIVPSKTRKSAETDGERKARLKHIGQRGLPQPGLARTAAVNASPGMADGREVPVVEPPRAAPMAQDQAVPAGPVSRFPGEPATTTAGEPAAATAVEAEAQPIARATPPEPAPELPPEASQTPAPFAALLGTARQPATERAQPLEARILAASASAAAAAAAASQVAPSSMAMPAPRAVSTTPAGARLYLTPAHDVVDAPTIGPRMAERLLPTGIRTVGDLLAADPAALAGKLAHAGTDAGEIRDWQDQARLVCEVPGLRGTHAQLLVGAGLRSAADLAAAVPDQLCALVLAFAATPAGHRVLRQGEPPDIARIKSWVDSARQARAA